MITSILASILAIIPGLAISFYIYHTDKHEKEPHRHLIYCFLFGMLSTVPAIFLEEFGQNYIATASASFIETFFFAFIVVALSEELVKFVFLRYYIFPKDDFNEPMDGIVYAVMIGMGFATLENLMYADSYGVETAILRMFTAVPAHGAFAVVMGYYAGLAKFDEENKSTLLAMGLFFAVALHGAYDFFIFQENYPALAGLTLVTLAYGIYIARQLIKEHQNNSPFRFVDEEPEGFAENKDTIDDNEENNKYDDFFK